jgi:esterase FrsA
MNQNIFSHGMHIPFVGSNEQTPLPAIFYFALSGHDSLHLAPFNEPVTIWKDFPLRIFSLTIPFHDEHFEGDVAFKRWKEDFEKGNDPLTQFFSTVSIVIDDLIKKGWIDPQKIGIGGLSRGGFVAAHVAAIVPQISHVLGFAPLTTLQTVEDLAPYKESLNSFDLIHLVGKLPGKKHRYYIGNHDTRVSTASCFRYVEALTKEMYYGQIRQLPAELYITPSIGRHGHGTSSETFKQGALWLANSLLSS